MLCIWAKSSKELPTVLRTWFLTCVLRSYRAPRQTHGAPGRLQTFKRNERYLTFIGHHKNYQPEAVYSFNIKTHPSLSYVILSLRGFFGKTTKYCRKVNEEQEMRVAVSDFEV